LFLFLDLDLRTVRATDKEHNEEFLPYLGLRMWCLLLGTAISLAVGWWFFTDKLWVFAVVVLSRVGDSLSNLAYGGCQRRQQTDLVGQSLTAKGLVAIVLAAFLAWVSSGSAHRVVLESSGNPFVGWKNCRCIDGISISIPPSKTSVTTGI